MKNIFSSVKHDIPSSIVVFLVALPLCLGIALASGAPMMSGLIAGIVGGVVVGACSGSNSSVSGPAAGLAAIVLSSILELGSFDVFLVAVVLAGSMQLVMGLAKGGIIANYIPSNVIRGLLTAIGIILIFKQIPHAFGVDMDAEGDFSFFQPDGKNTLTELVRIWDWFAVGAIIIAAISLFILMYWEKLPLKAVKIIPSSLIVVIVGVLINNFFHHFMPSFELMTNHLVAIPKVDSIDSVIRFPDFASISNIKVWTVALTIALVASLETLLNLEAVDDIDPQKRKSPPNRELIAQGIGNMTAGFIGGLPITSVIVRSSANITAGAQTKLSAILHGLLLLISVLLLTPLLNKIPLSSLAAILIVVGYKLAKVSIFVDMYKRGLNQFIPFIVTVLAIYFTDLLIGIGIGLSVSIFYLLKSNLNNAFSIKTEDMHIGETIIIELPNQVTFLNKSKIKDTLWAIPKYSKVIIDATHCQFIDIDVLDIIRDFTETVSKEKKLQLNIFGVKAHYEVEDQIQFVNIVNKAAQQKMTSVEVVALLKKGNERFVNGKPMKKNLTAQANATFNEQNPIAVILSCIDSRTAAELIFDLSIGDVFSVRVAGNIVNEDVLGSIEFGCKVAGSKMIVVLGHSNCGAVKGACDNVEMGHLTGLLKKIQPAVSNEKSITLYRTSKNKEFVEKVTILNVKQMVTKIVDESPIIKEMIENGEVGLIGAIHDLATGKVEFYEETLLVK
jgi:carbonic anhydrase